MLNKQRDLRTVRVVDLERPSSHASRVWWVLLISMLLTMLVLGRSGAQGIDARALPTAVRKPVPFAPGEKMAFEVRFSGVSVGSGRMEVIGTEEIRGREAWRVRFSVKGGVPLYRVNDRMESWIDTQTLESLRFVQDLNEGGRDRERHYEIFPDKQVYLERGNDEPQPSVEDPLDDASFLYFVRTLPLEVGKTYEFNRYFRPDRNPVRIKVVRRDTVKVPAGTYATVVLQPVIKTKGIFSEQGHAEMWISDDERRLLVQLKTKLSIGSLNLYLRGYDPGSAPYVAPPAP